MANPSPISLEEVIFHFEKLEDPRSSVNRLHPLVSVVVIALMAVLAGATGPTSIAKWASLKEDFLRAHLDLPHGIPAKDVFRRVLMALRPEAFQAGFDAWLAALRAAALLAKKIEQPVLAVDGKTARRSHDRKKGLGALHCVSVWASELGLSLGQLACAEKSNEITAIPELLKQIDLQGAIITIDAMGTQKEIAAQIVRDKADYVLALKGNQKTLHRAVIAAIDGQLDGAMTPGQADESTTTEKRHGRAEKRTYFQMVAPRSLPGFEQWAGLKTVGMVTSCCVRGGVETIEIRYYLSSLSLDMKRLARAVRGHWGIENSCHWVLDLVYREDESRIREARLRENFAWLNRFSLSLLKQHPSRDSIAMKRRGCGWNENYLLQVITGAAI